MQAAQPASRPSSPQEIPPIRLQEIVATDSKEEFEKYLFLNPDCLETLDKHSKNLLMSLIIGGATRCAKHLLDKTKVDIHHKDAKNRTVLIHACASGSTELVGPLLAKGASIFDRDQDGWTALHYAVFHDQIGIISLMSVSLGTLLYSRLPELFTEKSFTPLHLGASRSFACFEAVLSLSDQFLDAPDHLGMTPLHRSVAAGSVDNVRKLLSYHPKVNVVDLQDRTPLSIACQQGQGPIAQMLLDKQANPNKGSSSPLLHAYLNGDIGLARKLLEHNASPNILLGKATLLEIVAALGDNGFAEVLIQAGATKTPAYLALTAFLERKPQQAEGKKALPFSDVELLADEHLCISANGFDNNTHLHEFVIDDEIDFDKLVSKIEKRSWDTLNAHRETPFLFCCRKGSLGCCLRLLNLPFINVNARNRTNDTALHISLFYRNILVFYFLVSQKKIPVNAQNEDGETALHIAVKMGLRTAVEILLKFGADPNLPDKAGNTPLHYMAETTAQGPFQVAAMIDQLVMKRADLNLYNRARRTPLHFSWKLGKRLVFMQLLNSGANPDALCVKDRKEKTLLMKACKKRDLQAVEQLILAGANRDLVTATSSPLFAAIRAASLPAVRLLFSRKIGTGQKKSKIADPNKGFPHETALQLSIESIHTRAMSQSVPQDAICDLEEFKIFQCLLEAGATVDREISCPTKINQTALTLATQYNLRPVVLALLAKKASVEKKPKGNVKALRIACLNSFAQVAEDLIQAGAKISKNLAKDTSNRPEIAALFGKYQGKSIKKGAIPSHMSMDNLPRMLEQKRLSLSFAPLELELGGQDLLSSSTTSSRHSSLNPSPRSQSPGIALSSSPSPRAGTLYKPHPITADDISKLMEALSHDG